MDFFGILGWILAAGLGGLALYLASRKPAGETAEAQLRNAGGVNPPPVAVPASAPPSLRTEEEALRQTLGFLDRAVLPHLREARRHVASGPASEPLERALDAMGDLAFFAESPPDEGFTTESLAALVQESVREYTIETRIPVRVHAPSDPVEVRVRREALKDAVFLLLANAGRFSEGRPVDVYLEALEPAGFRIRIADEGPGFTPEALDRALEPFWSTDPLGVGMGLPQARARVSEMKGRLGLRNQESAGAEVTLEFPERDTGPAA